MATIKLKSIDTRAPKSADKETYKAEAATLKARIGELQNLMYAESKHALLVVLQGMDASGKDGTIKNVFSAVNPMGCRVIAFKKPTELEMKHDFLWRIHAQVPERGMIHIFNRSHYEDVIIQRIHKWVDEKTIKQRFKHINHFEQLLTETGTVVLKFYLHVSPEEQLKRLQQRLSDETKKWKHNDNDMRERELWNDYMKAYEDAFEHCSENAEWTIVPADQNWYKEYIIAKKIVDALEALNMRFPGLKQPE
ncbi:MAG: polyphosphate kinase [Chitinophagales bacterium]|nr:polyphosphate kinase [Chitinophagales bacterium]